MAAAWSGDTLIGVAPFMRTRTRGLDELVGLADGMSVRGPVVYAPGAARLSAALVARALAGETPPHLIRIGQVDLDDPWPEHLRAAWPSALPATLARGPASPVPVLAMAGLDHETWLASKSGNFRQRTRREVRRMEARGARLGFVTDPAGMDRALAEFHRLHAARWGDRSVLASPAGLQMMRSAAAALGPDRFRVHLIEVDGAAVSVQIFVAAGGELVYWNGGWDPDWAQHSPALTGIVAALQDGFARGDRRLDLGEDDSYDYKTRIADGDAPVAGVTITPRGPRYAGTLVLTAPRRARRLARRGADRLPDDVRERVRRLARRG